MTQPMSAKNWIVVMMVCAHAPPMKPYVLTKYHVTGALSTNAISALAVNGLTIPWTFARK